MSGAPALKPQYLAFQCDRCGRIHYTEATPEAVSVDGPEGWVMVKLIGFSAEAAFEAVVCDHASCRDPLLASLGFESYEEYLAVVKACDAGQLPRGEYTAKAEELTRSIIAASTPEDDDADPKTIDALLHAIDTDRDPWDVN
jgi:hypothetical protein